MTYDVLIILTMVYNFFNILFDVNCTPFKLIFIKKNSGQYLILDVLAGYQLNTYLGEKLKSIKDMLN